MLKLSWKPAKYPCGQGTAHSPFTCTGGLRPRGRTISGEPKMGTKGDMIRLVLAGVVIAGVLLCPLVSRLWQSSSPALAGEHGVPPHVTRPPDIVTERLERPRPEQDRIGERHKPELRQAEAIGIGQSAAKKELGPSFDEYELNVAVYNPATDTWSVTFDPKPPHDPIGVCVIVLVRDDTKETDIHRCH